MQPMGGNDEQRLDALFRAYREACPTPEPSANFMPNLWARIEARQRFTFSFTRLVNGFVTAAVALSIALGVYMAYPGASNTASESYLEALAEARPLDSPDIVGQVRVEVTEPVR
jgi:ABC-type nitrate/sulfonate/bicarbonate transport system permease component